MAFISPSISPSLSLALTLHKTLLNKTQLPHRSTPDDRPRLDPLIRRSLFMLGLLARYGAGELEYRRGVEEEEREQWRESRGVGAGQEEEEEDHWERVPSVKDVSA